ncbi:VWA domain-containing protein [Mariprofundus sp. EBB-1]|uniref:VWA domain-containing protein n=1 Tax=Mariprofundus sp. EBB-1 TaxID=2650971 RepID=UPI000EF29082|nr:VWA domain-containing protein [Mariprofundus sp. EBB-1]RLL55085.1 VWA domain-containing protein [Mariprofundus sp. EBB-1]
MSALSWLYPWLLLLLPLPWFVWRFSTPIQQPEAVAHIPFTNDWGEAGMPSSRAGTGKLRLFLLSLIWLLLLLAAARPEWHGDAVELPVSGRDLVLAVDISGSMQMKDFTLQGQQVDRLTATKAVADAFIQRREGDRIGLILFGSKAYVQTPLTFDRHTVRILLDESAIGLAGKSTAIGDTIGLTVKRLQQSAMPAIKPSTAHELTRSDAAHTEPTASELSLSKQTDKQSAQLERVLILLTDGVNTAGDISPQQGTDLAVKAGLKIYTIGIGADSMNVSSFFGTRQINPSAELDEEGLTKIAEQTGGRYFRARDTHELNEIYKLIDRLEPVERERNMFRPLHALFMWPLATSLLLAMLLLASTLPWKKYLTANGGALWKH